MLKRVTAQPLLIMLLALGLLLVACNGAEEPDAELEAIEEAEGVDLEEDISVTDGEPDAIGDPGEISEGALQPFLISSSLLMGNNVIAEDGEGLGEVTDLLIEADGTVQYALVTEGGYTGLDEEARLVPWTQLDVPLAGNVGISDAALEFLGTAEEAEALPTYDLSPFLDDSPFVNAAEMGLETEDPILFRIRDAEQLIEDYQYQINLANYEGAEAEDVLIDMATGRVEYVVLETVSLGDVDFGADFLPIPWERLEFIEEEGTFEIRMSIDQLAGAPGLTRDTFVRPIDPEFATTVSEFWVEE